MNPTKYHPPEQKLWNFLTFTVFLFTECRYHFSSTVQVDGTTEEAIMFILTTACHNKDISLLTITPASLRESDQILNNHPEVNSILKLPPIFDQQSILEQKKDVKNERPFLPTDIMRHAMLNSNRKSPRRHIRQHSSSSINYDGPIESTDQRVKFTNLKDQSIPCQNQFILKETIVEDEIIEEYSGFLRKDCDKCGTPETTYISSVDGIMTCTACHESEPFVKYKVVINNLFFNISKRVTVKKTETTCEEEVRKEEEKRIEETLRRMESPEEAILIYCGSLTLDSDLYDRVSYLNLMNQYKDQQSNRKREKMMRIRDDIPTLERRISVHRLYSYSIDFHYKLCSRSSLDIDLNTQQCSHISVSVVIVYARLALNLKSEEGLQSSSESGLLPSIPEKAVSWIDMDDYLILPNPNDVRYESEPEVDCSSEAYYDDDDFAGFFEGGLCHYPLIFSEQRFFFTLFSFFDVSCLLAYISLSLSLFSFFFLTSTFFMIITAYLN
uniref:TFIIB-type domain-containing protein n=1 Tax=Heterorhabditis bacteriophora TaxID=37862 RepID=A0A1I7X5W5_HETBA